MRDRQRSKVYKWENNFIADFYKNSLTKEDCVKIFNQLQKGFNASPKRTLDCRLRFINGHGKCWHSYYNEEIVLRSDWGVSYQVLYHEYAHALTTITNYRRIVEAHGPEFVANYSVLLHLFHPKRWSLKEIAQSLNDANVDFGDFRDSTAWKVYRRRKIKLAEVA